MSSAPLLLLLGRAPSAGRNRNLPDGFLLGLKKVGCFIIFLSVVSLCRFSSSLTAHWNPKFSPGQIALPTRATFPISSQKATITEMTIYLLS